MWIISNQARNDFFHATPTTELRKTFYVAFVARKILRSARGEKKIRGALFIS